jgi:EAL domain-containing protein (putative c-di-GMP-specific phosphodiesterase class I)
MAEETGLIVPIGAWVLRTAAAQCAALRRLPGFSSLRMAVNLSARQFADDSLIPLVAGLLEQSGLSADGLELEITESLFMRNAERASRLLLQLKALGVQVAMDDFGTGYSSLAYLKRFPIDSIKIDRSFIQGLPHDGDDATITEAIIAMAHSLRLAIVAEGVENADQLAFLRSRGCEEIQGYFFSRPLPEDRLLGFLRRNLEASGRERAAPSEHIPVWP